MRSIPLQKPRRHQSGDYRSEVNGKIEVVVDLREKVGVVFSKLISDVRRDTWLDPAGSNDDEKEPHKEPNGGVTHKSHESETGVTCAVNEGEKDDGFIFPEKNLRE